MPMRLRFGRFYAPMESEHMILRDGKSVDARQAGLFDRYVYGERLRYPCTDEDLSILESTRKMSYISEQTVDPIMKTRYYFNNGKPRNVDETPRKHFYEKPISVATSMLNCIKNPFAFIYAFVVSFLVGVVYNIRSTFGWMLTNGRRMKTESFGQVSFPRLHQHTMFLFTLPYTGICKLYNKIDETLTFSVPNISYCTTHSRMFVSSPGNITTLIDHMFLFAEAILSNTYVSKMVDLIVESLFFIYNSLRTVVLCCTYVGTILVCRFILLMIRFTRLMYSTGKAPFYITHQYITRQKVQRIHKSISPKRSRPVTDLSKTVEQKPKPYISRPTIISTIKHLPPFIILVILLWRFFHPQQVLLSPTEVGLVNARRINFERNGRIPAWHILPDSRKVQSEEGLHKGSPIMLHLRDTGYVDSLHRVDTFRTLSSLGFHIFTPINPLSEAESLDAWLYLHEKTRSSTKYIWMEETQPHVIHSLIQRMCSHGQTPTGVVVETKQGENEPNSLELWYGDCESTKTKGKFNFVKCPVLLELNNYLLPEELAGCISTARTMTTNGYPRF